jgi:hypothetical protein
MMRLTRALVPLALAGVLLAGCGGGADEGGTPGDAPASLASAENGVAALEPKAIVDKAVAALDSAKSYSVKGEIASAGQKIGLDVKVVGDDVSGSASVNGVQVELLRVAGQAYLRGEEKFWQQLASARGATAQSVGDRWAKLSGKDSGFEEFFQIAEPAELLKPDGTLTKGGTKAVNGVKAASVVDTGPDGGTLYVATTGEPYPLLLEGAAGQGQVTFGDFGRRFDIKAPAAADVIDLDELMGK